MRIALWIVTLAFGAFTAWVIAQVGFVGIWQGGLANPGARQITLDLVISSVLLMGFVARDARQQGRAWWPWALVTLLAGSFGTLGYLLWPSVRRATATSTT